MEIHTAASVFATLGHPDRLAVLCLLMRFAPAGQRPTEIAQILGLKQNTLSHHLGALVSAGVLQVIRQGRSLYYSVNLGLTKGLIEYLALDVGRARPDLISPLLKGQKKSGLNPPLRVLFVCSGNSARSIMAEAVLRDLGQGRFTAHSAGLAPCCAPHPLALQILQEGGHDIAALHSKHISQFQKPDAPQMDVVITVCDRAAATDGSTWAGYPVTAHWGLPDPAGPASAPRAKVASALPFRQTYAVLRHRLQALVRLQPALLDPLALQTCIEALTLTTATTKETA